MVNVIGFPGLKIQLEVHRVAFTIFGKDIYAYALCILSGFLLGLILVGTTCKKRGVSAYSVFDIATWGLLWGIICARIYYCIFDWKSIDSFWDIFKIWEGGIAIYGALIGAILSTLIYCRKNKLNTLNVLDVCVPGVLVGQIIGRWGNFFNVEVYGKETDTLLRMTINGGAGVHPLFLYEGIWNFIGLLIILIFRDKKRSHGQVFFFYILWYGIGRLFLEGMRQNEFILYVIPDVLGISQLVAFLGIILGIVGIIYLDKKKTA